MYQAAIVLGSDEQELSNELKRKRFNKDRVLDIKKGEVRDVKLPEESVQNSIQNYIFGNIKTNEE